MKELSINGLYKSIDDRILLQGIKLKLNANRIYGLVGGNGAGKTTFFKCILGLSHSQGQIMQDGTPIISETINEFLKKVGTVFPFPDSYADYTIAQVFSDHLFYFECTDVDIKKSLESTGLTVPVNTKISSLSLGMKQRLNIAMALAHNPEILILDEPFNGLDRDGVDLLKEVIVKFIDDNKMVMVSSHSFNELEDIVTDLLLIQNGRLINESSIAMLREQNLTIEDFYRGVKNNL